MSKFSGFSAAGLAAALGSAGFATVALGLAARAGDTGHQLVAGMHRAIAALSRSGLNVVADHVLVEPALWADCAGRLADLPAYLVGVRCPLPVLEEREKARRNRTLGQAAAQVDRVHAHGVYDWQVDTALLTPLECALQIKNLLDRKIPPNALKRLSL